MQFSRSLEKHSGYCSTDRPKNGGGASFQDGGSVLEFDAGRKLRLGENDEVKMFRSGLALRFRASPAQAEFRMRAEPTNIPKNSRIQGSIFAE
jgi:hypothetical protein